MKNIVFDLGGVVFHRDAKKVRKELIDFFAFIFAAKMPLFWEEYDRGASTLGEVTDILARTTGCPREKCERFLLLSIDMQEPVAPTERLVGDLKAAPQVHVLERSAEVELLGKGCRGEQGAYPRNQVFDPFHGRGISSSRRDNRVPRRGSRR